MNQKHLQNGSPDDLPATVFLRAAWVASMAGPVIRDGGILIERGRIAEAGPASVLAGRHPEATRLDRPGSIVLPGLVNAHTHLELSEFSCPAASGDFVEWLKRLAPKGAVDLGKIRASVARSIPIGVAQCLRFGVTCVGDISRHCGVSRQTLRDGPVRVVSYGEVAAMAERRGMLAERLDGAADQTLDSDYLRAGVSPHAPYTVEIDGYRQCVKAARQRGMPLATHLAESPDEAEFLAEHAGPFRALWESIGAWDENVPRFAGGPIRFANAVGLLDDPRVILAHVNYCDDDEMALLAEGKASVAYCPRTHAYFSHPPHRWREMMRRGINVAVGTDSCASSPDLNLVDELRLLHRIAPQIPALELWKMATINAAKAIDMQDRVGALAPGMAADLALFAAEGDDPLTSILENTAAPEEVWVGGKPVGNDE